MTRTRFTCRLAALVAAFVLTGPLCAAAVTADGVATLDAGVAAARELAIRDALRQAAISQGAQLDATQLLDSGNVNEASTLTAPALRGKVQVLNEYAEDGLYHVKIAVAGGAASAKHADPACAMPAGRALRRRLVTSYFDVSHPDEAPDMPDLATALPTELARRLSANPSFAVRNANRLTVLPQATISEPATGWNTVREIGRREDAQFVVSGRVLSTAVTGKGLRPTLFESNNTSQQGAYYTGPFAGLLGGAIKYQPTERQFDAELWVYDALTGALLANERISELGQGDVMPRPVLPFASAGFWQTDYGRAVDRALQRVTQRVADVIGCIPFSARVARVESGNRVYINAGGLDGLSPGDRLLLYKPLSSSTIRAAGNGRELGIPESLSGDVSVIQVQPNFSIGIANRARLRVEEGDYLRLVPHR